MVDDIGRAIRGSYVGQDVAWLMALAWAGLADLTP